MVRHSIGRPRGAGGSAHRLLADDSVMALRMLVIVAALLAAPSHAQRHVERPRVQLLPVDEAAEVPAFKKYRDALQGAVAARDADRVLTMMHPELRERSFEHTLRLRRDQIAGGREHQDWIALEELLRLGGTFTKGLNRVRDVGQRQYATREFCAPYVWSAYPREMLDPLLLQSSGDPWVVLDKDVAVRTRPPDDMRILLRLDYDLVHQYNPADIHAGAPKDWIGILTPDGRRGYVASHLIRSPTDYYACFGEFGGTWLMTAFKKGF